MKKILQQFKFVTRSQLGVLFILALADVAVFAFPSYLSNFLPALENELKIRDSELSQIRAIYGYVSIGFYILGAYIADKFNSKYLISIGLFLMGLLGLWYSVVPIINQANYLQILLIYIGFSVAIKVFFWGPLWKLVSLQGTKEQVGVLNGVQGSCNGFIGMTLAIIGIICYFINPKINGISLGFLILTSLYTCAIFISVFLVLRYVKTKELTNQKTDFSLKAMWKTAKNLKIWLLGFLIMGIYMFQMGLSVYTDYLKNIFNISVLVVFFLGIIRTYSMRFFASSFMGKVVDKSHSYIFLILLGLLIAIGLTVLAICLPGFNNDFDSFSPTKKLVIQIFAGIGMILLGATAWCLVTIRWSPISTELKIPASEYATAVNVLSIIAFTPDAFFQQIRSIIQNQHYRMVLINGAWKPQANQLGNQLILTTAIGIGLFGFICGIILYWIIYYKEKRTSAINLKIS